MLVEKIEYKNDEYDVKLSVRQATVLDGINRSALVSRMFIEIPHDDEASEVERYRRVLLLQTYPACLTATDIESNGTKELTSNITPEEFLTLPDALVKQWEDTVFRLNPHWVFRRPTTAEDISGEASEPNEETK